MQTSSGTLLEAMVHCMPMGRSCIRAQAERVFLRLQHWQTACTVPEAAQPCAVHGSKLEAETPKPRPSSKNSISPPSTQCGITPSSAQPAQEPVPGYGRELAQDVVLQPQRVQRALVRRQQRRRPRHPRQPYLQPSLTVASLLSRMPADCRSTLKSLRRGHEICTETASASGCGCAVPAAARPAAATAWRRT